MSEELGNTFWETVRYVLGGTIATAIIGAVEGAITGAAISPLFNNNFLDPSVLDAALFASIIAAATGIFAGLPAFAIIAFDKGMNAPFGVVLRGIAFHTLIGISIPAVVGHATAVFDSELGVAVYIYGIIVGFIVGAYAGVIRSARRWQRGIEEEGRERETGRVAIEPGG